MSYINKDEERKATKFKNMLSRKPLPSTSRHHNDYRTDREYSTQRLHDPREYEKALSLRNSFENSAAKIIRLRQASQVPRAPIEESMHKTSFKDSRLLRAEISKFSAEDFQLAFNEHAVNYRIQLRDVVFIVRSVMGADVPLWILNKFTTLGRQLATYKSLTWPQFRHIIVRVQETVDYESSQGGLNIPQWINGNSESGTGLVAYKHNSSYMADFNEELLVNFDNMKLNASRTGSTRDLFVGTTKDTAQLAGYSGHLPANTNNAKKDLHSKGSNMRPQPCYLRLVSERLGSMPSYSGHIPMSTGLSGERTTGTDPLTTTGLAFRVPN